MSGEYTIELPRIENESPRAYSAFLVYAEMGAGRSIDKARRKLGKSSVGYNRVMEEWSVKHEWQQRARRYDEALAQLAAQAQADAYIAEVQKYRAEYRETGKILHTMGKQLIAAMAGRLRGRTVETKQGELIVIPEIELNQNALTVAARAIVAAADLEAHALGLERLMQSVEPDDNEQP